MSLETWFSISFVGLWVIELATVLVLNQMRIELDDCHRRLTLQHKAIELQTEMLEELNAAVERLEDRHTADPLAVEAIRTALALGKAHPVEARKP